MKEAEIKRLAGYHLLKQEGTEVVFFEYPFHFGRRRADIISAEDGMIIGYEIKSAYDRIDRLSEQLRSYEQLFDYVYVVCDAKHLSAIRKIAPERVGIYLCSSSGMKRLRKAKQIRNQNTIVTLDAMPIEALRKEFKIVKKSKLETCEAISRMNKREEIKTIFRRHIIQKYGSQTNHMKSEISELLTLDDVFSLGLAPNKLDS
ncbi:sce7726 family protein [Pseudomonas sp. GD03746]|uniref:sce7726 family protein n=1 Tax=Pseudomonas sp. GD03746 TaxID=2975378 RepID=UPI002448CE51|nr:sce7726 family protein [Pseudomonas sp. GD03746]MDH1571574.1 sce7726 family protein [Pseudomonas sp. GD03746]